MAIDFYEKEVERLRIRFNQIFGDRMICDRRSKDSSILAIVRAGLLTRLLKDQSDQEKTGELTREFFQIRQAMNNFFDLMEFPERRHDGKTTEARTDVAEEGHHRRQGRNL